jgi:glycosyltransferase involved in cell wall biosynthesis
MKVVHIAPHFDNSGNGVVNVAVDLACMQSRSGHDVVFVGARGSFSDLLTREGVAVHSIPVSSRRRIFSTWQSLRGVLKDFDPDIVHAHMIPGALFAYILQFGARFKLITTVHSSGRFGSELMSVGDVSICASNYLADEMRARGMPSRKIRVVLNGPLGSPRSPSNSQTIALKRPAVITIAELVTFKGLGDLIAAFSVAAAKSTEAHLYILGAGPERSKFERQALASSCPDRIIFCGSIANPASYLQGADIFVLASHREGFGLAVAEARQAGCAIVATKTGGIPEVLDRGSAGILVPARSPDHLAEVLTRLIEDPVLRQTWRAKAHRNLEWLTCLRAAQETLSIYSEACGVSA